MADVLKTLPDDHEPLSNEEMNMMRDIFQTGQDVGAASTTNFYKPLIYGALFFILSLSITDKIIRGFIETTDLVLIAIKSAIFIVMVFLLTSFGV